MDFRQFRYFVTIADELHFARAAERLGIAQPALSQQIKALENQLGVQLFNRSKRRIELTETGSAFLQEARATLEAAEKAIRVAQDTARGEAGRIDIGFVGSVMYEPRFPHLLNAYRDTHPGVRLSLHEMPILTQIDSVHQQHLDIAIVREPLAHPLPDGLESFVLSSQQLVAVLPTDHALSGTSSVALRSLAGDAFIGFRDPDGVGLGHALLELCRGAGFEPDITQQVSEVATLISLVAAGFGVTLMVDIVSHLRLPGVVYVPLSGTPARSRLLVVHRRFERSATVGALLRAIRQSAHGAAN
jgi:DNA-binding transcriptional LysR family regulator